MRVLTVPSLESSSSTEPGDPVEGATTSHVPSSNRAASVFAVPGPHEYFSHLTHPSSVRFCHRSRAVGFITHHSWSHQGGERWTQERFQSGLSDIAQKIY